MLLITATGLQHAFGDVALLDGCDLSVQEQERIGLVGRNGSGKSTLLQILAGRLTADEGRLQTQVGLRRAYVPQEPVLPPNITVEECVTLGVPRSDATGDSHPTRHTNVDDEHWVHQQRVTEVMHRLGLQGHRTVGELSGGQRKRIALAQAMVTEPDVLLLDEPTNHLDLDSIRWLEKWLIAFRGSLIVISHDRAFLDAIATRIVELDRGKLQTYNGHFTKYQELKEQQLEQESVVVAKADKLLAQEEAWIRKGVEARRTRAQARIARLDKLRAARRNRRDAVGRVKLEVARGETSGKIVAELERVSKGFKTEEGQIPVVSDLSLTVLRSDKVALVGPNGVGKTTLLKLILGEIAPDGGTVKRGSQLSVAYFDQLRDQIDLNATLEDFISPGSEWIEIGTKRTHVRSYLGDFLFSPARAHSPVRTLSGGERNRLLLARLFARPANVLVLDEPTNDLDIDTLELLEELLAQYDGTVFLVSHDRRFVNNVATSVLSAEGQGRWTLYEGNVDDWLLQSQRSAPKVAPEATPSKQSPTTEPVNPPAPERKRKLTYKEQRELDALPTQIDAIEAEIASIDARLSDGQFFVESPNEAAKLCERRQQLDDDLLAAIARWDELGSVAG